MEPWRLHDLRRTFSTRLHDAGVDPIVIEALLAHKQRELRRSTIELIPGSEEVRVFRGFARVLKPCVGKNTYELSRARSLRLRAVSAPTRVARRARGARREILDKIAPALSFPTISIRWTSDQKRRQ